MSSVIQNDFFNIENRNGVQHVIFHNMDFKKSIYHTHPRWFSFLLGGIVNDEGTATVDQLEIAKLFNLPISVVAATVIDYLRYDRYTNDDSVSDILKYVSYNPEEDDSDEFSSETHFRYTPTKNRQNFLVSLINKNEASQEQIQSYKDELNKLSAYDENMTDAFVVLMRHCLIQAESRIKSLIDAFRESKKVTFHELYEILREVKDPLAIEIDEDVHVISALDRVEMHSGMFGDSISVVFNVGHYNGTTLKQVSAGKRIGDWKDSLHPEEIGVFFPNDKLKEKIIQRSAQYFKYTLRPTYAYHTGPVIERFGWFTNTSAGTGRCMVDIKTLAQVNPNFGDYYPYDANPGRDREDQNSKIEFDPKDIEADKLLNISPYVYIFSFVAKKWARTLVDNISDIVFREDAFDKLVIDNDVKDLMFSLVDTSKHSITVGKDIIDNKGGGSIFLLAGNPGCGKTLTAETMAETLKRPLYMVGVGELGTDTKALEASLTRVLNTASAWNAILLLDECDIFMEKRQNMDVFRNAMVGVFLRLLEYYPGILFLTTNRASNIDDAFYSRISLAIQYPDLDSQKRAIIWRNILGLYKDAFDTSTIDINSLANIDINGRQIKNCVRLVLTYCSYKNKLPATVDFVEVLSRMQSFQNTHSKHA